MMGMDSHPLSKFLYCPRCGSSRFVVNNTASKRCEACGFVYYSNPRPAVVAVIWDEKGRLLVARRGKEPAKGTLDLPGGFTENGETAEKALCREVFEETGIDVHSARYLFSEPNIYSYSGIEIDTMDLFFEVHVDSSLPVRGQDDVAEVMWLPFEELDTSLFGLSSIRKGLQRLKELRQKSIEK